jgi:hypothetical protein
MFDTATARVQPQPGLQQLRTSVASTRPGSPMIAALSAVGMVMVALTATAPAGVPRNLRSNCTCANGGPQTSWLRLQGIQICAGGSGDVRDVHARQPTQTERRWNAGSACARWVARLRVALVRLQRSDVDAKDALQHLRSRSRN